MRLIIQPPSTPAATCIMPIAAKPAQAGSTQPHPRRLNRPINHFILPPFPCFCHFVNTRTSMMTKNDISTSETSAVRPPALDS